MESHIILAEEPLGKAGMVKSVVGYIRSECPTEVPTGIYMSRNASMEESEKKARHKAGEGEPK